MNSYVANLPERPHEREGQHSFGLAAAEDDDFEQEESPSAIESRLLPARVNIQKSVANNRAKERVNFTTCPNLANESDVMLKNLPNCIHKTDKHLSQFSLQEQEHVRDYLEGCVSSISPSLK